MEAGLYPEGYVLEGHIRGSPCTVSVPKAFGFFFLNTIFLYYRHNTENLCIYFFRTLKKKDLPEELNSLNSPLNAMNCLVLHQLALYQYFPILNLNQSSFQIYKILATPSTKIINYKIIIFFFFLPR